MDTVTLIKNIIGLSYVTIVVSTYIGWYIVMKLNKDKEAKCQI